MTIHEFSGLLGEKVWIKQPLNFKCKRFPLTKITTKGGFHIIYSKAVVKLNQLYYGETKFGANDNEGKKQRFERQ